MIVPAVRDTDLRKCMSRKHFKKQVCVVWMILLHLGATLTTLVDAMTTSVTLSTSNTDTDKLENHSKGISDSLNLSTETQDSTASTAASA